MENEKDDYVLVDKKTLNSLVSVINSLKLQVIQMQTIVDYIKKENKEKWMQ